MRLACSVESMLTKIAPSSASRFRASFSRGYIMLSQSEWKRPLDSVLATSRLPLESACPDLARYSAVVSAKSSS